MAKYVVQVQLAKEFEEQYSDLIPPEYTFDEQFSEITAGFHDGTPEELAYWHRCFNAKRAGCQLFYVENCHILSVNGTPVPEAHVVHDVESMPCAGDTMFVRPGLSLDDFEIELIPHG